MATRLPRALIEKRDYVAEKTGVSKAALDEAIYAEWFERHVKDEELPRDLFIASLADKTTRLLALAKAVKFMEEMEKSATNRAKAMEEGDFNVSMSKERRELSIELEKEMRDLLADSRAQMKRRADRKRVIREAEQDA